MKKRIIIGVIACITVILAVGIAFRGSKKIVYNTIEAERIVLADDFEALEEVSDLIVRARVLPGKENILVKAPNSEDAVLYGYTVTELEILEIFKGDSAGAALTITEEYYTIQDISGTVVWTQGNYLPAREGEEYVFFLKAYDQGSKYEGMYFPVDLENGKYVTELSETAAIQKEAPALAEIYELKSYENVEEYQRWYEQVAAKYLQ